MRIDLFDKFGNYDYSILGVMDLLYDSIEKKIYYRKYNYRDEKVETDIVVCEKFKVQGL